MRSAIVLGIAVALAAFAYPLTKNKRTAPSTTSKGFAVVELFTSEGCSSCPPADKLVEKIKRDNPGKSIYILAYHVDYWDRLGWKDRFSDPAYTERQRRYADQLHLETIYTPQMVINGRSEYVGSDERSITKAITKGLEQTAAQTLALHARVEGGKLHVEHQAANEKNAELVLALVQRSATSDVKAGENAGEHLMHVQIVRQLLHRSLNGPQSITLDLPDDFTPKGWELVGFIQHTKNGRITAAASVDL